MESSATASGSGLLPFVAAAASPDGDGAPVSLAWSEFTASEAAGSVPRASGPAAVFGGVDPGACVFSASLEIGPEPVDSSTEASGTPDCAALSPVWVSSATSGVDGSVTIAFAGGALASPLPTCSAEGAVGVSDAV